MFKLNKKTIDHLDSLPKLIDKILYLYDNKIYSITDISKYLKLNRRHVEIAIYIHRFQTKNEFHE